MRVPARTEDALVRGALLAASRLGIVVDRAAVRDAIDAAVDLGDCAGRLAELLKTAARAQGVSLAGKVTDPW